MAKIKKIFLLVSASNYDTGGRISILTSHPKPSVVVYSGKNKPARYIKDKDLERFAVNILKALGSKKLKTN